MQSRSVYIITLLIGGRSDVISMFSSQSKGSQVVVQQTQIHFHVKKIASNQQNYDCPPQDNPDDPNYVCTNCCHDTVELCDSCYARIVNIHATENTQNDPDPPMSLVSPSLLDDISNTNDTENNPPSASGSGSRASASLVEITKTAKNKYKYKFTYKDVTQIPTATITPNMEDDIEDPENDIEDQENISDEEDNKYSTTSPNTSDSDTPILDFSTSNYEDPRVTDEDPEYDSNGDEIVEGMQLF